MRILASLSIGLIALCAGAGVALASQLTYRPINPQFGGDPNNGSFQLAIGQNQGHGKAASAGPDLSGLNSALSNLGTNLGSGTGSPIIVIPSTPTNP